MPPLSCQISRRLTLEEKFTLFNIADMDVTVSILHHLRFMKLWWGFGCAIALGYLPLAVLPCLEFLVSGEAAKLHYLSLIFFFPPFFVLSIMAVTCRYMLNASISMLTAPTMFPALNFLMLRCNLLASRKPGIMRIIRFAEVSTPFIFSTFPR